METTIYTLGHSNRSLEAFLEILKAHGIRCVADVRTISRSRHNPQFNADALGPFLKSAGVHYTLLPRLGGLRKPRKDSRNLAWRNSSFRGFADYMETEEFEEGLQELLRLAAKKKTAILCAEAVYWRCHRSLIADALLARGIPAMHIMSPSKAEPHRLTSFAKIEGLHVRYPAEQQTLYSDR
ncbi:MAG: DUF488 domain-containing protein [Nitrospirae bacterium]|nr:DUF488 domain-containing protein [Nitrospirota bacterium]